VKEGFAVMKLASRRKTQVPFARYPMITVTTLSDPFDDDTLALLRAQFRHHVKFGRKLHVIDLDQLNGQGSTIFRSLITSLRTVREVGGEVRLVSTRPAMRRTLELTALDRVFAVHSSVKDAMIAYRELPKAS
jgi:anti-sigma B factor antagonist